MERQCHWWLLICFPLKMLLSRWVDFWIYKVIHTHNWGSIGFCCWLLSCRYAVVMFPEGSLKLANMVQSLAQHQHISTCLFEFLPSTICFVMFYLSLVFQIPCEYVSECLDPQAPPEKALRGSIDLTFLTASRKFLVFVGRWKSKASCASRIPRLTAWRGRETWSFLQGVPKVTSFN